MKWIELAQNGFNAGFCDNSYKPSGSIKTELLG